jgi:hypothetical protein
MIFHGFKFVALQQTLGRRRATSALVQIDKLERMVRTCQLDAHSSCRGSYLMTSASVVAARPRARDLYNTSAREIAGRIAACDLSSAEVVGHFITRLNAVNGRLNAVVDRAESARRTAAGSDCDRLADFLPYFSIK